MSAAAVPVAVPRGADRVASSTRTIALAGCGVVGGAFAELLASASDVEITRVLVRDQNVPRPHLPSHDLVTDDIDDLLAAEADVVVEATGSVPDARRIALATLRRGATFITANKALVAACGGELAGVARRHGGSLRFDAAVGGGVPVLRILASALGGRQPSRVRGILNGTSNFVLGAIERGVTLAAALAEARARGFAEADATRDLDGRDAAEKLALAAWVAYGIEPERAIVRRRGLLPHAERLVRLAAALGGRLRLAAECELTEERALVSTVEPTIVAARSALGLAANEENRLEVHVGWSAPLTVAGPGAGGLPTATALLSDLRAEGNTVPGDRGTVRPAGDDRALFWAVGASVPAELLERVLCGPGIPPASVRRWSDADAEHSSLALAGPCRCDALERALGALPSAAHVVFARVDTDFAAVVLP